MAYANKYLFRFGSRAGKDISIYVQQDGFTGIVTQRPLGQAPVLKKEKNGPVCGTSLTFYPECHVDQEFAEFYTSDPKEYKVRVLIGSTVTWEGYITPELYAEPDIAPPYDVEVVATDGLGELKLHEYEAQGLQTLRAQLVYLLGLTGLGTTVYISSELSVTAQSVVSAGGLLDGVKVNLDYMAGESCYDVLTAILDTLHAEIMYHRGAWLVSRETDLTITGGKVEYYNTAGTKSTFANSVKTEGKMGVADMWPVGKLTTKVEPAKNQITVQAPWHPATAIANPYMTSDTGWTKLNGTTYDSTVKAYKLPYTSVGEPAYLTQDIALSGMNTSMAASIRFVGYAGHIDGYAGIAAQYTTGGTTYSLVQNRNGDLEWKAGGQSDMFVWKSPVGAVDGDRNNAQSFDFTIPAFYRNSTFPAGTLKLVIWGNAAYICGASLDVVVSYGWRDILTLTNDARGAGDTAEIFIGKETTAISNYKAFLQGIALTATGSNLCTSWSDKRWSNLDFLALTSRGYALSVAAPRLNSTGTLQVPNLTYIPLAITEGSINFWLREWTWNLLEDELEIDAISLPSATLTVSDETVEAMGGTAQSSTSPGSTGGGGGGTGGGHTHDNKEVLDGITAEKVEGWADAAEKAHTHSNRDAIDLFRYDASNNLVYLGGANNPINFAAYGNVAAGGFSSGGGGGTDVSWTNGDANYGVLTIAGNAHNVSILGHTHSQYMLANLKGAANGVAELGSDSKIPMSQLPDIVMGQLLYGGTVNASNVATLSANVKAKLGISSSTVTLTNGTGTYGYTKFEGVYFIMSADSSFASLDLKVGDWLISTGTAWKKIDNTDAVTGVKGQNQTSYQVGNVNISWDNVKPSAGVAKAELASDVQTSLGLADGALQKERFNVLSKQSGSSLATCDDLIGTCGIFRMGSKADSETPDAGGYGNLLSMFVPNADTYAQIYLGYYNDASRNIFFRSGRSDLTSEAHRTWHHVIHDGNTSEITTVGTITSGVWHGTAIAKAYLASDVKTSLGKADTAYQKASTGIPKTDLASAVQTSLGKADSALQAHQTIYAATFSAGTFSAKTYNPKSAAQTINIPTTTSHISEGSNLYFTNARAISACSGTYAKLTEANTFTASNTFSDAVTVKSLTITQDSTNQTFLAFTREGYNYITVPSSRYLAIGYASTGAETIVAISGAAIAPYSSGNYKDTTTLGTAATPWQAVYGKTYYADCTSGATVMNAKLQNGTTYSIMGASSNTPSGWTGWTTPGVLLGTTTADTSLTLRSGSTIHTYVGSSTVLSLKRSDSATAGCYIRFANNASTNPYIGYFGVYKSGATVQYRWYKYSTPTSGDQTVTKIAHLDTDGNFVANGQVTAGAASDLRFKKNIESMSRVNAESILAGLRPVEFDWNELGTELSGNKGHDTGLIAQEVLGVFPYAVSPIYERYLRVDYAKLTPILVAGWQSHETRIEKLERENMELREQIKRLRS